MTFTSSTVANGAIFQMFSALDSVLTKAEESAKGREIEEEIFLSARLAPDMLPMVSQVRIATELPARALSRLAGADMPSFADDETSFAALRARATKALAHIKALDADAVDHDPSADITVPFGPGNEMTMPRAQYLQGFILPNLYFHMTMTYAILRHNGVELGKRDFLAA